MVPVCGGFLAVAESDAAPAPSGSESKSASGPLDLGGGRHRQRVDFPRAEICPPGHRGAGGYSECRDPPWAASMGRKRGREDPQAWSSVR